MRRPALAALAAGALLAGCPEPPAPADPSFAQDVAPLFSSTCAFSSCHGGTAPPGGIRLGPASNVSPSEVRSALVDAPAKTDASLVLVRPGDPDGSFLVRKLEGRFEDLPCGPDHCGERMPQRNFPLSDRDIQLVRNWVSQGAKDN